MTSEHERIRELTRIFAWPDAPEAPSVGIGDDAAVLRPSSCPQVLTVDAQVEGVHFRRDLMTLEDVGYRALVSAASDLAAMGARPRCALWALVAPPSLADEALYAIAAGMAEAARQYACPVVGGNLARGGELALTTTVAGECPGAVLTRGGARVGDRLFVAGELGMSALGLRALHAGRAEAAPRSVDRFRRPVAHIADGLAIANVASAAIDVSDGLLQDLGHVALASGVGFELVADALPTSDEHARGATALGLDALELALAGGEDYALLFTAPAGTSPSAGVEIGHAVAGGGITLRDREGHALLLPQRRGFDHFGR